MVNYPKIIKQIDLSMFPVKLELSLNFGIHFLTKNQPLCISMEGTKNPITGIPNARLTFDSQLLDTEDEQEAIDFIYWRIQEFLLHELAECFHVNKKQVYRPHEDTGVTKFILPKPDNSWTEDRAVSVENVRRHVQQKSQCA